MQSLRRIPTFYSDCLIVVIIMMDWNWSMVHVVSKNANSVSLDTVQCVMFRAILAFCQATSVKFPLCVVVSRNLPHRRDLLYNAVRVYFNRAASYDRALLHNI